MKTAKREKLVTFFLYLVLAFYLLLLFLILFRQRHSVRSFNLVPFRGIFSYLTGIDLISGTEDPAFLRGFALSNLLGNIVIFIPLGVYFTLLNPKKGIWRNTLLVMAVSAAVEMVQFAFQLGIGDVDDVILNGIGGLLGVLLCKGLYRLCKEDEAGVRRTVAIFAPIAGILSFAILILQNYGSVFLNFIFK